MRTERRWSEEEGVEGRGGPPPDLCFVLDVIVIVLTLWCFSQGKRRLSPYLVLKVPLHLPYFYLYSQNLRLLQKLIRFESSCSLMSLGLRRYYAPRNLFRILDMAVQLAKYALLIPLFLHREKAISQPSSCPTIKDSAPFLASCYSIFLASSTRAFLHSQTAFESNKQVSSAFSAAWLTESIKYFAPFCLICMSLLVLDAIAMTSAWKIVAFFQEAQQFQPISDLSVLYYCVQKHPSTYYSDVSVWTWWSGPHWPSAVGCLDDMVELSSPYVWYVDS
ncbi:hypothetical protein J6590_014374 [Homalodisca vitripennis]|nr:hypothetical protein J6590_014374 [Homalodisca vitripennis]